MKTKIQNSLMTIMFMMSINLSAQLTQKANFTGTSRMASSGCSINNIGYLIGGFDSIGARNDFWNYTADGDLWTQKANFPGNGRYGAVCVSVGKKIYYGTGLQTGNSFSKDFWEYDSESEIWTQKQNFPGAARIYAVAFSIMNKIYLGTGTNGSSNYSDFWEFNPDSNKWTQKANFPGGNRSGAIGFSINNKGYLGTGTNGSVYYKDFWEFNSDSNKWTQKANIGNFGRSGASSFLIDNVPYVALGFEGGSKEKLLYYNINDNTWNSSKSFDKIYRTGVVSFVIGKKLYFGTGTDSLFSVKYNDFFEFDPSLVNVTTINKEPNYLTIFPNPSTGMVNINTNETIEYINITDVNGKLVHHQTNNSPIDLSQHAKGIYFVNITTEKGVINKKIVLN
ncbi:MAG: kelch repeat-containing protein [Bacteroidia bacterium]